MLIHLVRKDFLIVKKYVLLMLAVCVFIPPFMMWRIDDATYVGSMSFILAAIFSVFMLLQYVSLNIPPVWTLTPRSPTDCFVLHHIPANYLYFLNMFLAC